MNRIMLIGHLGRDAEQRHTQSGSQLVSFTLATTSKWKDDGGKLQERTEWHRCTAWGDRYRNLFPYLTKGAHIALEGEVRYRKGEHEGKTITYTDIHVNHIELVGSRRDGGQRQERQMGPSSADANGSRPSQQKPAQMDFDDDIPF